MTLELIYKELLGLREEVKEIKAKLKAEKGQLLTVKEAAAYLRMSESRLYKISCPSNNIIPSTKLAGGKKVFSKDALEQYVLDHQSESIAA